MVTFGNIIAKQGQDDCNCLPTDPQSMDLIQIFPTSLCDCPSLRDARLKTQPFLTRMTAQGSTHLRMSQPLGRCDDDAVLQSQQVSAQQAKGGETPHWEQTEFCLAARGEWRNCRNCCLLGGFPREGRTRTCQRRFKYRVGLAKRAFHIHRCQPSHFGEAASRHWLCTDLGNNSLPQFNPNTLLETEEQLSSALKQNLAWILK